MRLSSLLLLPALACVALAQQPSSSASVSPSASASASASASPTQSAAGSAVVATRIYTTTLSRGQARPSDAPPTGSVYATYALYITTLPASSSSSSSVSSSSSAAAAAASVSPAKHDPSTDGLPLDTHIDGAFGVLGVLLIASGLALAIFGPSIRWLFCFITGAYWLALTCICLIFKLGIQKAVFDPSPTTRGLFLLAAAVAGILGGVLCIFWWTGASLLAAGLGGLALGVFVQACKADGLIGPLGLRWILYIACTVAFASLSCWRRVQTPVHIVAAALAGSTALVLGIDCFSTAGLKEFYARNILGNWLFEERHVPTFADGRFPLVTVIQIELGVIGGCTVLSLALQSKMFGELRKNLRALRSDDEDRRTQSRAKRAAKSIFRNAQRDLHEWEVRHGYRAAGSEMRSKTGEDRDATLVSRPKAFPRDSTMSLLPMHTRESRSRNDSVATTFLEKPSAGTPFAEDMGVAFPSPSKADEGAAAVDTQHATPEQAALIEEIAEIRRSITLLRSRPNSMVLEALPAPASDGMARTESSASSSERHAGSKPAPWITSDRSPRARALSRGMSMDLASIPDELLPPVPSASQADAVGAEASARRSSVAEPAAESKRPFSMLSTSSALQLPDAAAAPAPATHGRSRRLSRTHSNGLPQSPPLEPTRRVIVDTPEAAAARYAKALNRRSTASAHDGAVRQSGGAGAGLTLSELEERHRAQMSKMQSPTAEAFKLALAKEEYEKRKAAERRAMEAKERARAQERRQSSTPGQPSASATGAAAASPEAGGVPHSRSRSLSIDMLKQAEARDTSAGQKRASGAMRAAQWRNSLAEMPVSPPHMARDGSRSPPMAPQQQGGSMGRRGSNSTTHMAGSASYFAMPPQAASMGRSYSTSPGGLRSGGAPELQRVFEGAAEAATGPTTAQRTSPTSPRKPLTEADRRRISEGALGPRASLLVSQQQAAPLMRFDPVAAQAWEQHVALQQLKMASSPAAASPAARGARPSSSYFA